MRCTTFEHANIPEIGMHGHENEHTEHHMGELV